jgi:hypothetical protein
LTATSTSPNVSSTTPTIASQCSANFNFTPLVLTPEGRLAIGVTSTQYQLEVAGKIKATQICLGPQCYSSIPEVLWQKSGNNIVYNAGNVGIGTTTPNYKLTVNGDLYVSATSTLGSATSTPVIFGGYVQSNIIPFSDNAYTLGAPGYRWANVYAVTTTIGSTITIGSNTFEGSATTTLFTTGNANQLVLGADGNVGIGTTTPLEKLDVAGAIKVGNTSSACDANHRGVIKFIPGASGVADHLAVCEKDASDTYNWVYIGSSVGGFKYRKPITINNTQNSNALTDYQVLVTLDTSSTISAGKMRSDCGDIRFTDSDGVTNLNYWLESGCNTTSTKIWVKVPSIPASSTKTIYVYYGNPSASSASNGSATFIFFDHFESSTPNSQWIIACNGATSTLNNPTSMLRFSSATYNAAYYCKFVLNIQLTDFRADVKVAYISVTTGQGAAAPNIELAATTSGTWLSDVNILEAYWSPYNRAWNGPSVASASTPVGITYLTRVGSDLKGYYANTASQPTYSVTNSTIGYLYIGYAPTYNNPTLDIDYVIVRKYTSPEPTTSVGTEEAADIAEWFKIDPNCSIQNNCPEPGDLVVVNENGFIEKSSKPYQQTLIGVISTNPKEILGDGSEEDSRPVALIGAVPVKVSTKNGEIKVGDYLTSSDIPGVAMKANGFGRVIGMALEPFGLENDQASSTNNQNCSGVENCDLKIGKIKVLINPHFAMIPLSEDGNIDDSISTTSDSTSTATSSETSILDPFTLAIKNVLKKLGLLIKNGIAQIKEIITEKLSAKVVVTNQLCLGQTCIDEAKLKELLERSGTMGTTNNQTTNNQTTNNGTMNNATTSNETVSNQPTNNEATNNEATSNEQQTMSNEQSGSEQSNSEQSNNEQLSNEQLNSEQSGNEQSGNEQSGNLTETESVSNNSEPSTTTTQ